MCQFRRLALQNHSRTSWVPTPTKAMQTSRPSRYTGASEYRDLVQLKAILVG